MKLRTTVVCVLVTFAILLAPVVAAEHGPEQDSFNETSTISKNYAGGGFGGITLFVCPDQLFLESDPVVGGNPTGHCTGGHRFVVPKGATNVTITVDDVAGDPTAVSIFPIWEKDAGHQHGKRFCTETKFNMTEYTEEQNQHHDTTLENITHIEVIPAYNPGVCPHDLIVAGGSNLNATAYPTEGKITMDWSSTDNISTDGPQPPNPELPP